MDIHRISWTSLNNILFKVSLVKGFRIFGPEQGIPQAVFKRHIYVQGFLGWANAIRSSFVVQTDWILTFDWNWDALILQSRPSLALSKFPLNRSSREIVTLKYSILHWLKGNDKIKDEHCIESQYYYRVNYNVLTRSKSIISLYAQNLRRVQE